MVIELEKIHVNYNGNLEFPKLIELEIPNTCAGLRLDQALSRLLPQYSRHRLQGWISKQLITLNGAPVQAKQRVWGAEQVAIQAQAPEDTRSFVAQAITLDVRYEDDTLLIINKAPGLVVHPGSGNWEGTLLNALLHRVPENRSLSRAGIVHRLDKDTSGLLVVAKTPDAFASLSQQLANRSVKRQYLALVHGDIDKPGRVEKPIGRHLVARTKMAVSAKGKSAVTHFRPLERYRIATLVECNLETGRTHQIRVHMQSIGHALIGDPVYGRKTSAAEPELRLALSAFPRQALHAQTLQFMHPTRGDIVTWTAELPGDMQHLIQGLRDYSE